MSDFEIYLWFFVLVMGFLYLEFRVTLLNREMDTVLKILEDITVLQERADADLAHYIKAKSNG